MEKIKLGIVGFGFMGHNDADMMATFDDIDLVYLDGVHPIPDGHAFMANEVIAFMDKNRGPLGF